MSGERRAVVGAIERVPLVLEGDAAAIDEILALKVPPPLNITPIQVYGAYSASTDGLQLTDLQQKVDVLVDAPTDSYNSMQDPNISQDAIDVAFLREKQRRQS